MSASDFRIESRDRSLILTLGRTFNTSALRPTRSFSDAPGVLKSPVAEVLQARVFWEAYFMAGYEGKPFQLSDHDLQEEARAYSASCPKIPT